MVAVQNKPIKPVTMMKNTNECFKERKSTIQTETGCFFLVGLHLLKEVHHLTLRPGGECWE